MHSLNVQFEIEMVENFHGKKEPSIYIHEIDFDENAERSEKISSVIETALEKIIDIKKIENDETAIMDIELS